MAIVVGAPLRGPGKPKIGAVILLTDGGTAIYEKQHLHAGEEAWFDPGAGGGLLDLADLAVAHAICADIAEESHAAAAAVRGAALYAAGVLITPAGYDADAALLQSYAAIHGMAVLLANYHGHSGRWPCAGRSAFWSADGRLLACAPADCDALVIATRDDNGWSATVVPA
jgi:predicted amidohydrolase